MFSFASLDFIQIYKGGDILHPVEFWKKNQSYLEDRYSVLTFAAASDEKHTALKAQRKKLQKKIVKSCTVIIDNVSLQPLCKKGENKN